MTDSFLLKKEKRPLSLGVAVGRDMWGEIRVDVYPRGLLAKFTGVFLSSAFRKTQTAFWHLTSGLKGLREYRGVNSHSAR